MTVLMMLRKVASRWMTAGPDDEDAIDQVDVEDGDDHVDHDEDDAAQGGEQVDDSCSNPPQGVHGSWSPSSWGNNYLINKLIANGGNIDLFPEFNGGSIVKKGHRIDVSHINAFHYNTYVSYCLPRICNL